MSDTQGYRDKIAKLERALDAATKERDEAKSYISKLPSDWFSDSSLQTWFPISYETMENQHATIVSLRAQLSALKSEHSLVLSNLTHAEEKIGELQEFIGSQSATNRSPRIYTKCPACHCDTLTINDDKHLLCTWIDCPNPTLIDKLGEATPQDHAQAIDADFLEEQIAFRLEEALADGKIARNAIQNAPHDATCQLGLSASHCTCWKAKALEQTEINS